jgi:hypothetical protein
MEKSEDNMGVAILTENHCVFLICMKHLDYVPHLLYLICSKN